jgi:hypothetical protein
MAWIYLAESEQSAKPWRRGSERLPIVKSTHTLEGFFCRDNSEAKLNEHQYGMTLNLFEESCSHKLILSAEDFPVRTSHLPEISSVWRASEANFFGKLSGLEKKQKRRLFFSKTSGQEYASTFQPSELRLNQMGTNVETACLVPQIAELTTDELVGSCWPTPTASRGGYNRGGGSGRTGKIRYGLEMAWKLGKLPTLCAREYRSSPNIVQPEKGARNRSLSTYWKATTGTNMPASFCEWIMGFQIGATAYEPWAIPTRRRNTVKRSKDSPESSDAA